MIKFYPVPSDVFHDYISKNQLVAVMATMSHRTNYVDSMQQVKARYTSSSWNPNQVFEIADERYANMATAEFVKDKFK